MIYSFSCLLLDPFQQYLETSVIFGLSICTASAMNCIVGTGSVLLDFFWVGWVIYNKGGLQVYAEKMKIISFALVGKCHPRNVS